MYCFEGPKEDWYSQLGHPRLIKNLLYILEYVKVVILTTFDTFYAFLCNVYFLSGHVGILVLRRLSFLNPHKRQHGF